VRVKFDGNRDIVDRHAAARMLQVSVMTIRRYCKAAEEPERGPDGAIMYDLDKAADLVAHVRSRVPRSRRPATPCGDQRQR
jgi:hypothetical protein